MSEAEKESVRAQLRRMQAMAKEIPLAEFMATTPASRIEWAQAASLLEFRGLTQRPTRKARVQA